MSQSSDFPLSSPARQPLSDEPIYHRLDYTVNYNIFKTSVSFTRKHLLDIILVNRKKFEENQFIIHKNDRYMETGKLPKNWISGVYNRNKNPETLRDTLREWNTDKYNENSVLSQEYEKIRKRSYVRNSLIEDLKNQVKYDQGSDTWNIFSHNIDNDRSIIVPTNESNTHVEKQVDPICIEMHRIADEQRNKRYKLVEAFDLKHSKNPTDIIMQDVSNATSHGPNMINHLNELIRSQDEKIHDLSHKMKAMTAKRPVPFQVTSYVSEAKKVIRYIENRLRQKRKRKEKRIKNRPRRKRKGTKKVEPA